MTEPGDALDHELVDSLFATDDPADQAKVRAMVEELRVDVAARLAALTGGVQTLPEAAAGHELHQLRGSVSGFGLKMLGRRLAELERDWAVLPVAAREQGLKETSAEFERDFAALRRHLKYL